MVDPSNVTNFRRTRAQLEEFLLFTIVVAGKRATVQARKLADLLGEDCTQPFQFMRHLIDNKMLHERLKQHGIGQYTRIWKAFVQVSHSTFDLRTVGVDELCALHGIGLKTAKFFILHSRPNERHAVLDTHALQKLRKIYPRRRVPRSTPGSAKEYFRLEKLWLDHLDRTGCTDYAAADLAVWNAAQPTPSVSSS